VTENKRQIHDAAMAANRFGETALAHLDHPNAAALQRDGQALMDALKAMGFR
jgi:hypothetical protein